MTADEGGKTRLANVTARSTPDRRRCRRTRRSGCGRSTASAGRSEVPIGPLGDQVDGQPRSAALDGELEGQTPSTGGAVSFTTLRLLYADAHGEFP